MKRSIGALLIVLTVPTFGAIALVDHKAQAGSSGVSTFSVPAMNNVGATLLVCNISSYGSNSYDNEVSDSLVNTWIAQDVAIIGATGQYTILFYVVNPKVSSSQTITITHGRAGSAECASFSGVTGVLPFDQVSKSSGSSSTVQPGALTPTYDNSLIVTGAALNAGQTFSSINSSFTITDSVTGSGLIGGSLAYLVQGAAASVNPTWTFSGATANNAAQMVFIAGSAEPPASPALINHVAGRSMGALTTSAVDMTGANFCAANVTTYGAPGSMSDSTGSNTWTALTSRVSSASVEDTLFYAANASVSSTQTFTVGAGTSINTTMQVACFSGVKISCACPLE